MMKTLGAFLHGTIHAVPTVGAALRRDGLEESRQKAAPKVKHRTGNHAGWKQIDAVQLVGAAR